MGRTLGIFAAIVVLAAALYGALVWRSGPKPPPQTHTQDSGTVDTAPIPAPAPPDAASAASEPAIEHPLEEPAALAPLSTSAINAALAELVGTKALKSLFQTDDFAHRIVATVDNLGRAHTPPQLWPINPAAGRFTVDKRGEGEAIATGNSQRYLPLVMLAESMDAERAVDLYVRLYPQLQKAYADLGFPRRYFNDRVIEVIDLLLAAPEADQPLEVQLTEVKGPVKPVRPWVRYEYADARLEALSSGQRIMLRVGPQNELRLKQKLREFRAEILKRSAEP